MTILESVLAYLPEEERDYWLVYGNDDSLTESVEQYSKHKTDISTWVSKLETEYDKQKAYKMAFEKFEEAKYDWLSRNAMKAQFLLEHKDFKQEKNYCHAIALKIAYCKFRNDYTLDCAESEQKNTLRLMPPLAIRKACDDGYLLENDKHLFENQKDSIKNLIDTLFHRYRDNMPTPQDLINWVVDKTTQKKYDPSNIYRYCKSAKNCKGVQ